MVNQKMVKGKLVLKRGFLIFFDFFHTLIEK